MSTQVDYTKNIKNISGGGGGGGAVTYDTYANKPAAGNPGAVFIPSDGLLLEVDDGTKWVPQGLVYPDLVKPVLNDFSWINQGSAVVDDSKGYIKMTQDALSGLQLRMLVKTAPSTPYSITAMIIPDVTKSNYNSVGLVWRESSTGRVINLGFGHGDYHFMGQKYTNPNTWNSNYFAGAAFFPVDGPIFLRLTDNGTDRLMYYSHTGNYWRLLHSVGRTDFMTADQVGFYVDSENASYGVSMDLLSWKEH